LDESLRKEIRKLKKHGVKTTCVCPYYINTGMFDGVKGHFLLPILQPDYVVSKIVTAIKRNQAWLVLPRFGYLIPLFRALLPTSILDFSSDIFGIDNSMDTFSGNSTSFSRKPF